MKKIILIVLAVLAAFFLLSTCTQSAPKDTQKKAESTAKEVADQVTNIADSDNEYVLAVKNGINSNYPDTTYGEAFDNFFSYPTWKYFNGTLEGPDDDEDGKPDYVEENIDVVEFTGYCMYHDAEVKVRLQFHVDMDAGTFEVGAMSYNDVPQTNIMTAALLQTAFENELK